MNRSRSHRITGIVLLVALGVTATAVRADVFRDVAFGLGYANFDIRGDRNILSGGADFLVTNTFRGNALDFGPWDLTLQGPISLSASVGTRAPMTFDVALRTAPNAVSTATPLSYVLNYDVGGQQSQISGTLFIDTGLSVNSFGFYDLQVNYSSRQSVELAGRVANDSQTFDFDLGPTSISGNIFADVLAVLTDPLFEAVGQENVFENFSGRAQLKEMVDASVTSALTQLASGEVYGAGSISTAQNAFGPQTLPGTQSMSSTLGAMDDPATRAGSVVPEPSVLVLMLLGVPAVLSRRRRRR